MAPAVHVALLRPAQGATEVITLEHGRACVQASLTVNMTAGCLNGSHSPRKTAAVQDVRRAARGGEGEDRQVFGGSGRCIVDLVHANEHARDFSCVVALGLGRLRN